MNRIDFLRDEVRCGFYVPTAIKQAWATQLNILSEIDRICKKYSITYFAEWGTLLGAVRHGGFVPWDDDIDISMKREDYNRFLEVAEKELPEEFAIHNFNTKENHWLFLARVVNTNQICFEKEHLDKNYNFPYIATVDIFILDYLYSDEKKERERCNEVKYIIALADKIVAGKLDETTKEYYCRELENKYSIKIVRGISNHDLGVCLYELAEMQMARTKYEESDRIGQIFPWIILGGRGLPKEYYESTVRLPFEYTFIPVASRYLQVLWSRYTNYKEIHKIWSGHDYPYFEGQKKNLQAVAGFKLPEFEYSEKLLRKEMNDKETYPEGSYKEIVNECKNYILNYGKDINRFLYEGCFDEVLSLAIELQQIAIDLGTYIEQIKGEKTPSVVSVVEILELLCNDLVAFYDCIENNDFYEEVLDTINKDISNVDFVVTKELLEKKQVLFVVNDAKYWDAYAPYYAANVDKNDIQIVHVPILYKDAYGELMMSDDEVEKAVSINDYDEELLVFSWDTVDLQLLSPEVIYIQWPYDAENPCFTTPKNYYTTELLKHCKELVYVPIFDVDEFNETDITTMYNTKHYLTMPGVVSADKTLVQSEKMRNIYIDILTKFAGEQTRKIWQDKLVCRTHYLEKLGEAYYDISHSIDVGKRKKILYCLGIDDFFEHNDIKLIVDNKLEILYECKDKFDVDVLIYPYILDQNEVVIKIINELLELLKNKDIIVIKEYEKVSVDDYDVYYGCMCPISLDFSRRNKPVLLTS